MTDQPDDVDEILEQWERARPDLDAFPMAVFGRVARNRHLATVRMDKVLANHGLTLSSFDVLANLRRSGPPYRKTPSELAESSMLTSGGITFRLDRLEADGLIRRVPSRDDRRVVYAELTDRGLEVIDKALDAQLELEQEMLHELSKAEAQQLVLLLKKLERSIRAVDEAARQERSSAR